MGLAMKAYPTTFFFSKLGSYVSYRNITIQIIAIDYFIKYVSFKQTKTTFKYKFPPWTSYFIYFLHNNLQRENIKTHRNTWKTHHLYIYLAT